MEKRVNCNFSKMSAQDVNDNSSEMSESLESVVETNLSTMSDNFSWSIKPEYVPKEPKPFAVICEDESDNNENRQLNNPTSRWIFFFGNFLKREQEKWSATIFVLLIWWLFQNVKQGDGVFWHLHRKKA